MGKKILAPFDGMACGMLALLEAGIEVDRYVAYEIDKFAIKTSSHNFPMIEHRGDVFDADFTEFEGFDYLMGGSPCTFWSIAQTKNRETVASGLGWELFQQFVRALKEAKPKAFIYENNKSMSEAIKESITETFGFEPICINSSLVSAQNRQRLYWVGIRQDDGTYKKVNIEQPEDKGIFLKDILEGNATTWRDKAHTIDANYFKGGTFEGDKLHQNSDRLMVAEPIPFNTFEGGGSKSRTVMAGYYKYGTATMITNEGFKGGTTGVAEPVLSENSNKQLKIYEVKGGKVLINEKKYPINLEDGFYHIRKLTVRECMRLQQVPEWYEFPVSNSQAYKMLGNGWSILVIKHLIDAIENEMKEEE